MTSHSRAEELRALADSYDGIEKAEAKLATALAAYTDDPTPKTKAAFKAASEALVEARQAVRGESTPRAVAPGDISITPNTAGKG